MIAKSEARIDEAAFSQACHTIYSPETMTRLLWDAVPVLKSCDFRITDVKPGYAETRLPLNHATTNQHGTHQAALISLSADYTGGMALTTAFAGDPLAGIHRCDQQESASLWLVGMDMRYHKPSTGHMIGTCNIDRELFRKLSRRYHNGKRVLVPLDIEFRSNGDLVATGELKYYAQTTSSLQKPSKGKISSLVEQKLKASARMIAGIRATVDGPRNIFCRVEDRVCHLECENLAKYSAGAHGILLAEKMLKKLPQLISFVRGRTEHIDATIGQLTDLKQIVLVGAGLDLRTLLHAQLRPEIQTFELDLPEMLAERQKVIDSISNMRDSNRTGVECDFLNDSISERMLSLNNFNPSLKTAFIYEGCSMYFHEETNRRMLSEIRSLMQHEDSILWVDFVSENVLGNGSVDPGIIAFLDAMVDLGEKFVFGKSDCAKFFDSLDFQTQEVISTDDFLRRKEMVGPDSVLKQYQLCVAKTR